jgi:hypothetical protein
MSLCEVLRITSLLKTILYSQTGYFRVLGGYAYCIYFKVVPRDIIKKQRSSEMNFLVSCVEKCFSCLLHIWKANLFLLRRTMFELRSWERPPREIVPVARASFRAAQVQIITNDVYVGTTPTDGNSSHLHGWNSGITTSKSGYANGCSVHRWRALQAQYTRTNTRQKCRRQNVKSIDPITENVVND